MEDLRDDRDSWSNTNCSVARAMDIVGSRSTLLIMRDALLGTRRFDDFVRRVGIGEPAIASRLKEMVAAGLLERIPYREPGQRTRHEYRLTTKGRELLPVITALRNWGDAWAADDAGPPIIALHHDCGEPVRAVLRCAAGHDVDSGDIDITAGPGLIRRD
ncbi:winged helix-turn-helix transcriptional regulator [Micromonospora profundi]|uniref:Helix-turn-helix domain-containing protein n=1 Tax=Micromonospora profundi TaxID=1420889 RepID=A0AAJ6HUL3_9ACTN|nr:MULTISPECIES: helix-turn-helix domain-containing protein [Micromonospora]KOX05578.1 HxlR family transcriptional regulator [Micromonospora sp. NRRL B-16802]NJC14929.1 DNA-binding HxlR family transcriptional regulator [Micromonospora profundi]WLS46472.1 helix-turn-helix domain-containing protein [Micromonospora profundi]